MAEDLVDMLVNMKEKWWVHDLVWQLDGKKVPRMVIWLVQPMAVKMDQSSAM
jgi:hypothetical protein